VRKQAAEEAAMVAAATAGPLPERTGSPADTAPTLELPQMEAWHGDLFAKHFLTASMVTNFRSLLAAGAGQGADLPESGRGRRARDAAL
jgi:hypothetical protein